MKKQLALILVLALLFSIMAPMQVLAASSNRITNVPTVQEDDLLTTLAPFLVIEEEGSDFGTRTQFFTLRLEKAEWLSNNSRDKDGNLLFGSGGVLDDGALAGNTGFVDAMEIIIGDGNGTLASNVSVSRISNTRLEVTFQPAATGAGDEVVLRIPMWTKATDEGDARVTILPGSSRVTGGTYTFASVVDADTVVNIESIETFGPEETLTLGTVIIDETVAGAIEIGKTMEFSLPRDFEWAGAIKNKSVGDHVYQELEATFGGGLRGAHLELVKVDGRDLHLRLAGSPSQASEGFISINAFKIYSDSTRFGDVEMKVGGALTSQTLKIAEYKDYGVTVKADGDIVTILSGRFDDETIGEGFELTTLVIEEDVADSIVSNRAVKVEFPKWVKLTDVSVEEGLSQIKDGEIKFDLGDSKFEFTPLSTDKFEFEFDISVTVEADAEGDIEALVSGRGLERDYTVLLGEAIQPVDVEMELTEILIGESGQALAEIVITENEPGALMEGWLGIDLGINGLVVQSGFDVDVDEDSGLEIDEVKRNTDDWSIAVEIDRESDDEPAVITISNVLVSLNRIPATGDYDVRVGGSALVNNSENTNQLRGSAADDWEDELFDTDYVWEAPKLRVILERIVEPVSREISFVVGQNSYMVDGEMRIMDVAPFISNDRLMVPVRYLEELFGMQPIWNANARSVTVMYEGRVYAMTIGSDMLTVNGAPFMELDANVEIVNDRTFVPASRFARAMGIEYSWDAASQTATFK